MSARRRAALTLVLLAPCAVLAGCGHSSAKRTEEVRTTLRSWQATLALLEEERGRGAVPSRFSEQVRRAADEERHKAEAKSGAQGS
jgi:outer membrane biogenesis lipoprotein LolB